MASKKTDQVKTVDPQRGESFNHWAYRWLQVEGPKVFQDRMDKVQQAHAEKVKREEAYTSKHHSGARVVRSNGPFTFPDGSVVSVFHLGGMGGKPPM